jgi:hypothetical protein
MILFNPKRIWVLIALFIYTTSLSAQGVPWSIKPVTIKTRWTKDVSPTNVLPEYPRPQMVRANWQNLNGLWNYSITPKDAAIPSDYEGQILVPYPLESALSGVKKRLQPSENLWYKRSFIKPIHKKGEHVLLHFGAVDWQATVYVNGKEIGSHTGGYQSFSQDITTALKDGENEVVVKVFDPTNEGIGPHGKQVLNPANIYYTPSSGIWQTVWLEIVPVTYIAGLTITPDIDKGILNVNVDAPQGTNIELTASDGSEEVSKIKGRAGTTLSLPIKNAKLWSPVNPFLYGLTIKLTKGGRTVDEVKSYFGMRKVAIQKDEKGVERIFLNNNAYFNLGILDQGFWPDGLYTAPTDNALKFDIEVIKAMGFNTIRKHIKIEPARWYYHADRLGILVWQDFVNPNQALPEGAKFEYEKETKETLEQLHNYPAIVSWVIFNEKWGAYDQQRITEWVKTTDPSRIVNGHSGELLYVDDKLRSQSPNAYISSDVADVHSYPFPRPILNYKGKAKVLGEFGGLGVNIEGHSWNDLSPAWGYDGLLSIQLFRSHYSKLIDSILVLKGQGLSACIYTQPFDVEAEQNGIITYDREIIKVPLNVLRDINNRISDDQFKHTAVGYVSIRAADTIILEYSQKVKMLKNGLTDSSILRSLAISALSSKDTVIAVEAMNKYFDIINDKFNEFNLKLINRFIIKTDDKYFNFFYTYKEQISKILGKNVAENTVLRMIQKNIIDLVMQQPSPDIDSLETELVLKYGYLGKEKIWQTRLLQYLKDKDWANYGKFYKLYFDHVLPLGRNSLHINNMSWAVFENINDIDIITSAINAMKYNISHYDSLESESLDTYANLLYKSGKRAEAINWESKAWELSKGDKNIKATYEKMLKNERTWR